MHVYTGQLQESFPSLYSDMPPIPIEPRDVNLNLLSFLFEAVVEIKDNPGHWFALIG